VKTAAVTRGPLRYAQTFPANISYNEYQQRRTLLHFVADGQGIDFINKARRPRLHNHVLVVKTAAVTRGPLRYAQTFPANISYNEYQYVIMQARACIITYWYSL
jgi:hypothetical protein